MWDVLQSRMVILMKTSNVFAEFLLNGQPGVGYDMDNIQYVQAFISFFCEPTFLFLKNGQLTFTDVFATRFLYDFGDLHYYRLEPSNRMEDPPFITPGELTIPWYESLKSSKPNLSWDAYNASVDYMYDDFTIKIKSMSIQYEVSLTTFGNKMKTYSYKWNSDGKGPF